MIHSLIRVGHNFYSLLFLQFIISIVSACKITTFFSYMRYHNTRKIYHFAFFAILYLLFWGGYVQEIVFFL